MASGRPLVASAVGCLPETVEDGVTGRLVPPGDAAALAAALRPLLKDGALRARVGAAARQAFERRFTSERFVNDTLRVYQDAIDRIPS